MTKMYINRIVVEQALETIEGLTRDRLFTAEWAGKHGATIAALRAALAQQDEPVEPVATLTAQRDALLEALKLARSIIGHPDDAHTQMIDAAIKAMEGEKT